MLTLELPWGDVNFDYQIEDKVLAGEHLVIPEGSPTEYVEILEKCWNFEPQRRPPFVALIPMLDVIPVSTKAPLRQQLYHNDREHSNN